LDIILSNVIRYHWTSLLLIFGLDETEGRSFLLPLELLPYQIEQEQLNTVFWLLFTTDWAPLRQKC